MEFSKLTLEAIRALPDDWVVEGVLIAPIGHTVVALQRTLGPIFYDLDPDDPAKRKWRPMQ